MRPLKVGHRWTLLALLAAPAHAALPDWVPVRSTVERPQITAFAGVQSGNAVDIASVQAGVITELNVQPGSTLAAGQIVARLGGPGFTAALVRAQGAEAAAAATFATETRKLAQRLSTNAAVAQAKAALDAARANLATQQQAALLRSPVAGAVQSVRAAAGDLVQPGQAVAVVQPMAGTWLKAVLYDAPPTALTPGTPGLFTPAEGGASVPVTLRGALGQAQADGGLPVAFTASAPLRPGAAGTLTVSLRARSVLLVPSEALVLDQGRWWVMLHDGNGDHPAPVTPGAVEGNDTVIETGLSPGQAVDVTDADLLYHRGIAARFQPPD